MRAVKQANIVDIYKLFNTTEYINANLNNSLALQLYPELLQGFQFDNVDEYGRGYIGHTLVMDLSEIKHFRQLM